MTDLPDRDPRDIAAEEAAAILEEWRETGKTWGVFFGEIVDVAVSVNRRHAAATRLDSWFSSEGGQLPLISDDVREPKRARAPRRVRMHAEMRDEVDILVCPKCHTTAPVPAGMTEAARKRGIPCPRCNQTEVTQ